MRIGSFQTMSLLTIPALLLPCMVMSLLSTAPMSAQTLATPAAPSSLWVTAYYISGDADSGRMPLNKIDFSAITHIIDFCLFPNPDGTFSSTIPAQHSAAILAAAHAAGTKVIVSMGSQDNAKEIRLAISDPNRANLVKNLVDFVIARGYDGIDLDYEPLEDQDVPNFSVFIVDLRHAMDAAKPGLLLSAAVASEPEMFAKLQGNFDQMNIMTYDLSGQYQDFKSWYNSNLYGDPKHVMENKVAYPSCDDMMQQYIKAGVAPSKLGIGIGFYGYVWTGVDGPREKIKDLKGLTINDGADYRDIMDKYYTPAVYHWDNVAKAPYLSIKAPLQKDSEFVSYDDEYLCAAKVYYAKQQHLGGVMFWELGAGYRPTQPAGQQDVLLQSIKAAKNTTADIDPRKVQPPKM